MNICYCCGGPATKYVAIGGTSLHTWLCDECQGARFVRYKGLVCPTHGLWKLAPEVQTGEPRGWAVKGRSGCKLWGIVDFVEPESQLKLGLDTGGNL